MIRFMQLWSTMGLAVLLNLGGSARADDQPWDFTRGIEFVSRWPDGLARMGEDRITAVLYRPRTGGKVPAAVIINASGGVSAHTDHYYARVLVKEGMAALVVDSFTARDVRRTGDDQNRVAQSKSNADAFAGLRWLAEQPWVDARRIIVMGMSRGGEAAYSATLKVLRKRMQVGDAAFAAHVAIAPGSCSFPQRDVRTIARPVFFMLAEHDQIQLVGSCVDYIERMRKAGSAEIHLAIYPGVHHSYESTGGLNFAADDWFSAGCAGRFDRDENWLLYHRGTNKRMTHGSQTDYLFKTCTKRGYVVGGDERVKAQATADLLQFLRDVDVLSDEAARAVVPDCTTIAESILRLNCTRARAGWTGDLVPLARAYLRAEAVPRDEMRAARLLELAVSRGNQTAKWQLSLLLRDGVGTARNHARALELAKAAADAGDATGMNVLGVMIRDGIGRPRDDAEARLWFERAADLLDSYAMANLGRYHRDGRAGLSRDPVAAVALWRRAILKDDNPWAQLMLAEACEKGEGVALDRTDAIALYRAAAMQNRDAEAKKRAEDALARLESRAPAPAKE